MRKLALDLGDARIGVAISDLLNITANPRETYKRKDPETDIQYFADYAKREGCDTIVLGLPINMDGTFGPMVEKVKTFGDELQRVSGIKVVYQDERLTTVSAEKTLISANVRRDKRKQVIDKVAATIILQSYLEKI